MNPFPIRCLISGTLNADRVSTTNVLKLLKAVYVKRYITETFFCFAWITLVLLPYNPTALFAEEPETFAAAGRNRAPVFSGVLDNTVNYTGGAGTVSRHSWGAEAFANLRLRINAGEHAVLHAALNLAALSGNYVGPVPGKEIVAGENYAALIELERLYCRINGEYFDAEAGLLRIPFGYSQVWGSSDFLNPRNPLLPNARTRGVLGANVLLYPADDCKLTVFAAAPKDSLETDGGGFVPGVSLDRHWKVLSVQALYAFQTPLEDSPRGLHRFGLSLKTDLVLGFVADVLYTLKPDSADGIEGLSAGAGFDYNFFDGDLYVLAEYLFNGSASVTAIGAEGVWANHHYLYGSALYHFNDFTSFTLSTVFCFDDRSFQPIASFNYEVFQGFSVNLTARLPLDQNTLNGGEKGELGPERMGMKLFVSAGVRLRF